MGTHPIFESDFDCLTEIGAKTRHVAKLHDGASHKWQGRVANLRWRH